MEDQHLNLSAMDEKKIADVFQDVTRDFNPQESYAMRMVLSGCGVSGICMCHAAQFLEKAAARLRTVIDRLKKGEADKRPPKASDVADRLLKELMSRPLQSERRSEGHAEKQDGPAGA